MGSIFGRGVQVPISIYLPSVCTSEGGAYQNISGALFGARGSGLDGTCETREGDNVGAVKWSLWSAGRRGRIGRRIRS